ncbi:MAG: AAA family ATPase [Erysipelotrichaceae bacterium]|nr:AAA family ATPase [Erysipelotrichaceae bacterium]MCI9312525.1 AAA family ATPase [Erysipelotrichaceae bacterium]MCI9523933.1 AAA family ATPase [Erysipelotrichaceae bacterium]
MNSGQIDIQAECIGTLSIYPKLFQHCIMKPEYFDNGYRQIFNAMSECYKRNNEIIVSEMAKYKDFNVDLYMSCANVSISSNIKRFKRVQHLVIEAYKERRIETLGMELKNHAITLEEYDKEYHKIIDLGITETSRLTRDELLNACKDDKKNIFFRRFRRLGALMKLKENDFVIVAGSTGGGKSGFALNLLEDLSANYKCLYFNLEMVSQELRQRLLSIKSNLTQDEIVRLDKLPQDNQNKVVDAINEYDQKEMYIYDKSQTLDRIRAHIATHQSDKHMIVIVDHIGLIGTKSRNAYERMTEIAKELRKYSLDFNCTIIGLCQLNRDAIKSNDGPKLSMLRDSGEIEQSASKVLFVWHEDEDYTLVLAKNRSGHTGVINIAYNKATQRMEETI